MDNPNVVPYQYQYEERSRISTHHAGNAHLHPPQSPATTPTTSRVIPPPNPLSDSLMPPPPKATFSNLQELRDYGDKWAFEHGYDLIQKSAPRPTRLRLTCGRAGATRNSRNIQEKDRLRATKTRKCGCPFAVWYVQEFPNYPDSPDFVWSLRYFKEMKPHNHNPMREEVMTPTQRKRARDVGAEVGIAHIGRDVADEIAVASAEAAHQPASPPREDSSPPPSSSRPPPSHPPQSHLPPSHPPPSHLSHPHQNLPPSQAQPRQLPPLQPPPQPQPQPQTDPNLLLPSDVFLVTRKTGVVAVVCSPFDTAIDGSSSSRATGTPIDDLDYNKFVKILEEEHGFHQFLDRLAFVPEPGVFYEFENTRQWRAAVSHLKGKGGRLEFIILQGRRRIDGGSGGS